MEGPESAYLDHVYITIRTEGLVQSSCRLFISVDPMFSVCISLSDSASLPASVFLSTLLYLSVFLYVSPVSVLLSLLFYLSVYLSISLTLSFSLLPSIYPIFQILFSLLLPSSLPSPSLLPLFLPPSPPPPRTLRHERLRRPLEHNLQFTIVHQSGSCRGASGKVGWPRRR